MAWSIIGRLPGAAASGVANFLPRVTVGFVISTVATLRAASHSVGVAVSQVATLLGTTTPGISVTAIAAGTIKPAVTPGITMTEIVNLRPYDHKPAAQIVQIKYDLVATNGSNAATSTGAQTWPNITNAQGKHDGVVAQAVGQVVSAQSFTARLAYAAQVNKSQLTITAVRLDYYYSVTDATSVLSRTLRATWTGGTYTSGASTGAKAFLTTPQAVDLFALGVTDWTKVNSVLAFVDATTPVAASTSNIALDAVELVITATQTIPQ